MNRVILSYHAKDRIQNRLNGIVSINEVVNSIKSSQLSNDVTFVTVKRFSKRVYLGNPSLPDTPKGDSIVAKAVYKNGIPFVITVMLRKSSSISAEYISH